MVNGSLMAQAPWPGKTGRGDPSPGWGTLQSFFLGHEPHMAHLLGENLENNLGDVCNLLGHFSGQYV